MSADPDLIAVHALRDATRLSRRRFLGGGIGLVGVLAGFVVGRRGRAVEKISSAYQIDMLTERLGRIYTARFRGRFGIVYGAAWGEQGSRVWQIPGGEELPTIWREISAASDRADLASDIVAVSKKDKLLVNIDLQFGGMAPTGKMIELPVESQPASVQIGVQDGDAGDDDWVAFTSRTAKGYQINAPASVVRVQDKRWLGHVRMSRNNRWLAFVREGDEVVLYDLRSNGEHILTNQWSEITGLAWADESQSLYFSAAKHGREELYSVTVGGAVTHVPLAVEQNVRLQDVAADGRILVSLDHRCGRAFAGDRAIGQTESAQVMELVGSTVLVNEEDHGYIVDYDGTAEPTQVDGRVIAMAPNKQVAVQLEEGQLHVREPNLGTFAEQVIATPGHVTFGRWISDDEMLVIVGDRLYRVGPHHDPKLLADAHGPFVLDPGRTRCAFRWKDQLLVMELATAVITSVGTLTFEEVCGWMAEPDAIILRTTRFPIEIKGTDMHGVRMNAWPVPVQRLGHSGFTGFFVEGARTAYSYTEQLGRLAVLKPI
ncbi:MAG: hypothetical protein QM831_12000 [Kofleriaceae bacterium]